MITTESFTTATRAEIKSYPSNYEITLFNKDGDVVGWSSHSTEFDANYFESLDDLINSEIDALLECEHITQSIAEDSNFRIALYIAFANDIKEWGAAL